MNHPYPSQLLKSFTYCLYKLYNGQIPANTNVSLFLKIRSLTTFLVALINDPNRLNSKPLKLKMVKGKGFLHIST